MAERGYFREEGIKIVPDRIKNRHGEQRQKQTECLPAGDQRSNRAIGRRAFFDFDELVERDDFVLIRAHAHLRQVFEPLAVNAVRPHTCVELVIAGIKRRRHAARQQDIDRLGNVLRRHAQIGGSPAVNLDPQARSTTNGEIEYIVGDFLSYPFAPESFDAVLSVATLHHMDAIAGLRRMRELVRPGGIVGVIGLARAESLADYFVGATGLIANWVYKAAKGYWEHPSPKVWPPPESWDSMHRIAARELPSSLLPQAGHHRQNPLRESAPAFALRPE
jgi:hypothetical protein